MNLYSHLITNILETFSKPLNVGDNYVDVVIVVIFNAVSPEMVLGLISTEPVIDVSL